MHVSEQHFQDCGWEEDAFPEIPVWFADDDALAEEEIGSHFVSRGVLVVIHVLDASDNVHCINVVAEGKAEVFEGNITSFEYACFQCGVLECNGFVVLVTYVIVPWWWAFRVWIVGIPVLVVVSEIRFRVGGVVCPLGLSDGLAVVLIVVVV